jgi:hypothetical protein
MLIDQSYELIVNTVMRFAREQLAPYAAYGNRDVSFPPKR